MPMEPRKRLSGTWVFGPPIHVGFVSNPNGIGVYELASQKMRRNMPSK